MLKNHKEIVPIAEITGNGFYCIEYIPIGDVTSENIVTRIESCHYDLCLEMAAKSGFQFEHQVTGLWPFLKCLLETALFAYISVGYKSYSQTTSRPAPCIFGIVRSAGWQTFIGLYLCATYSLR